MTLVNLTSLIPSEVWRMPSKLVHCLPTIWFALYIELATIHGMPGRITRSSFPHCCVAGTWYEIGVALGYVPSSTRLDAAADDTGLAVMVKVTKDEVGRLSTGAWVKDGTSLSGKPVVTVVVRVVVERKSVEKLAVVGRLSAGTSVKLGTSLSGKPVVTVVVGVTVVRKSVEKVSVVGILSAGTWVKLGTSLSGIPVVTVVVGVTVVR